MTSWYLPSVTLLKGSAIFLSTPGASDSVFDEPCCQIHHVETWFVGNSVYRGLKIWKGDGLCVDRSMSPFSSFQGVGLVHVSEMRAACQQVMW